MGASSISFLENVDLLERVIGGAIGIAIGILTLCILVRRWRSKRDQVSL